MSYIVIISNMPDADLGRELIGVADDYVDKGQSLTPLTDSIERVRNKKADLYPRNWVRPATARARSPRGPQQTATRPGTLPARQGVLTRGPLRLDFNSVSYRFGSTALDLSPAELWILTELSARANEPIKSDHLANIIGKTRGRKVSAARVRSVVYSLRQKLESDPREPQILVTVPRRGYKLILPQ